MEKLVILRTRVDCSTQQDRDQAELFGRTSEANYKPAEMWVRASQVIAASQVPSFKNQCYVDLKDSGTIVADMASELVPLLMKWVTDQAEISGKSEESGEKEICYVFDTREMKIVDEGETSEILLSTPEK